LGRRRARHHVRYRQSFDKALLRDPLTLSLNLGLHDAHHGGPTVRSRTELEERREDLFSDELPVHVFFRLADREPFSYAGISHAVWGAEDKVPVEIRWRFDDASQPRPERPPEEVPEANTYIEGAKQQITVNAYERNPAARRRCLEHYGTTCAVCGLSFETIYGDLGKGFIHVHHLRPLGEV